MAAGVGRSAALCSGILWTFSAAGRAFGDPAYLDAARYAHDTLCRAFWDTGYGGLYQSVEASGRPLDERKRIATQGAAITGLVEYHRATGDSESLALVQTLFRLVEKHSSDPVHGGNIDAVARDWTPFADSDGDRFSVRGIERGLTCHKSTATLLRLLDGYTALFRVWPTPDVAAKLRGLVEYLLRQGQPAEVSPLQAPLR